MKAHNAGQQRRFGGRGQCCRPIIAPIDQKAEECPFKENVVHGLVGGANDDGIDDFVSPQAFELADRFWFQFTAANFLTEGRGCDLGEIEHCSLPAIGSFGWNVTSTRRPPCIDKLALGLWRGLGVKTHGGHLIGEYRGKKGPAGNLLYRCGAKERRLKFRPVIGEIVCLGIIQDTDGNVADTSFGVKAGGESKTAIPLTLGHAR